MANIRNHIDGDLQLFKNLINQSNDIITVVDLETGRFLYVNNKACTSLGYNYDEFLSKKVTDVEATMPDEYVWNEAVFEIRRKGSLFMEGRARRKDGTTFPIETNVRLIILKEMEYAVAVIRDITERNAAWEALKETNDRLRTLIQTIPDVVYFKDLQGRNQVVNSAFEELVGLKNVEIIGKTDAQIFPSDLARQCRQSDERVMNSAKRLRFEEECIDRDGKSIFFDTIKTPLYDKHGNTAGLLGVSRDITAWKKAEELLKESKEQFRRLSIHHQSIQEEERKSISREIHDEFGQMLTILKYDISWIMKRLTGEQEALIEISKNILINIDTATATIQRISSELRPPLLDDMGIAAAIEWYAEDYQIRTGIECNVVVNPEINISDMDLSIAIFRAFQEALTNVARHAEATKVSVLLEKDRGTLVLRVTDNGIGISEKAVNDSKSYGLIGMRERFYPWEGEVKITGMKGKGTSITVCVPAAKD